MPFLDFFGLQIGYSEGVYEPSEDTFLLASALDEVLRSTQQAAGLRVLDMGTGTGAVGLFAAMNKKISKVVLADISTVAVNTALGNYRKNKKKIHADVSIVESDLFKNVVSLFDIITFNAPYLRKEERESKEYARLFSGGKEGVELSLRFLKECKKHIDESSIVLLTASSLSNLDMLRRGLAEYGFYVCKEKSVHYFFEDVIVLELHLAPCKAKET